MIKNSKNRVCDEQPCQERQSLYQKCQFFKRKLVSKENISNCQNCDSRTNTGSPIGIRSLT